MGSYYTNDALANRAHSFFYAKKGSLTKVIYPTGGHTNIEYKPHVAYNHTIGSGNMVVHHSSTAPANAEHGRHDLDARKVAGYGQRCSDG